MKKEIKIFPDAVLRKKSEKVKDVSEVTELIADMKETLEKVDGIGLAAPQIGVSKQVFVVKDGAHYYGFMNPEVIEKSEETIVTKEGCLSFPDLWIDIERPKKIKLEVLTEDDERVILEAEGLGAVVFQHEMDHLFGTLFIDHLSFLNRIKVRFTLLKNGITRKFKKKRISKK